MTSSGTEFTTNTFTAEIVANTFDCAPTVSKVNIGDKSYTKTASGTQLIDVSGTFTTSNSAQCFKNTCKVMQDDGAGNYAEADSTLATYDSATDKITFKLDNVVAPAKNFKF